MMPMQTRTIHAMLIAAGKSLNIFWILNILKEAFPAVKSVLNFYPVTGPLLGIYLTSIFVLVLAFFIVRSMPFSGSRAYGTFAGWYFVVSVLVFFFAIFPPVYVPIVEWIVSI